jgi:hypothetical protein
VAGNGARREDEREVWHEDTTALAVPNLREYVPKARGAGGLARSLRGSTTGAPEGRENDAAMSKKTDPTTVALRLLEKRVRVSQAAAGPPRYMFRAVPRDLARKDFRGLTLNAEQCDALDSAKERLSNDLRFEYLSDKDADEALWHLACEVKAKPGERGWADAFAAEYAEEPIKTICFLSAESLTTEEEVELFGVRLLPPESVTVPEHLAVVPGDGPIAAIFAIEVTGTSFDKMSERARARAVHALRLLRATLRQHHLIHERQLRFGLGSRLWFADGRAKWSLPDRAAWPLGIGSDLVDLARSQAMSGLPATSENDVDEQARIALRWFKKAQLDDDQLTKMLFLFFALEAILGDRSEGLKAPNLALRRALLGHAVSGGFTHPARTYSLYDEVRSSAVHGGYPEVTEREVVLFTFDVRNAINEFLAFALMKGFKKRSRLVAGLDNHKDRSELVEQLYTEDPERWSSLKPESDQKPIGG